MTGIMQVLMGGQGYVAPPPPPPLSVGISGAGTINVSGESGTTDGGPYNAQFTAGASGGVPPYSYGFYRANGENTTFLVDRGNGTAYVTWSGQSLGYNSTTAIAYASDSIGQYAESPSPAVIGINRVS